MESNYASIAIALMITIVGSGLYYILTKSYKKTMDESVFASTGTSMKSYWEFYDKICKGNL